MQRLCMGFKPSFRRLLVPVYAVFCFGRHPAGGPGLVGAAAAYGSASSDSPRQRNRRPLWVSTPLQPQSAAMTPVTITGDPFLDVDVNAQVAEAALKSPGSSRVVMPVVTEINSIGQFLDFVRPQQQNVDGSCEPHHQLSVVKYTTKFCKLCQRVDLKYRKLALKFGDTIERDGDGHDNTKLSHGYGVRFATVEYTAINNRPLCQMMEIPRFPYVEIYNKDGDLMASFATGPVYSFGVVVRDAIREHLEMSEEDQHQFRLEFDKEIMKGRERLDKLKQLYLDMAFGK